MKDGVPLSYGHYRLGMAALSRKTARDRLLIFHAARVAQSPDLNHVREWLRANNGEAQW